MRLVVYMLVVLLLCSCEHNYEIIYYINDGYKGFFAIHLNKKKDKNAAQAGNKVEYRIPQSGFLEIASSEPLSSWHQEKAFFMSGKKLVVYPSDETSKEIPVESIMLFPLSATSDGTYYYFVGTYKEYSNLKNPDLSAQRQFESFK